MFLAAINKSKQLLYVRFVEHVQVDQLERGRADLELLLQDLNTDFSVLADLSCLDRIDANCAGEIGRIMELLDKKGIGKVVRVIPDPSKDIGLNILAQFHYHNLPSTFTCEKLSQAAEELSL